MKIEQFTNQTLLFLGKSELFGDKEIINFLTPKGIGFGRSYEGQKHIVAHRTINPLEEDISHRAYEMGATFYTMEAFEKAMSDNLDSNALLMSIKLSHDNQRLRRMLLNEHLSDELYLKLLNLYGWEEESFGDSSNDRDVLMATLKRFLDLNFNETDLYFSPLSLLKLAKESDNAELLLAMIDFPSVSFLQKNKTRITLQEALAQSPHINRKITKKLLSLRDDAIAFFIASNEAVELDILKTLYGKSKSINQALASNRAIDDALFEKLLDEYAILLQYQPISMKRYAMAQTLPHAHAIIATNHALDDEVIEELFANAQATLMPVLLLNPRLNQSFIERLYRTNNPDLYPSIARHPNTPIETLQALYERDIYAVTLALAANPSTPIEILQALYREDFELHKALASNPSTPLEILNILKIDTRLRNELTHNKTFTDSIIKSQGLYW
ncbi:MAG: hypothetical protein KU38_13160 [Sulfurovum sp. FS08-3]|nr:MAG: hypothetical protein KU38_13160 [Sulfurovum sp. FS08-3]